MVPRAPGGWKSPPGLFGAQHRVRSATISPGFPGKSALWGRFKHLSHYEICTCGDICTRCGNVVGRLGDPARGGPWSSVGSPKNVGSTPDSASGGPRGGVAAQCPRSGLMGAAGMRRGLPSVRPKSLKDVARRRRSGGRCGRDAGPLAPVPRALRSVGSPRFRARLRCVFPGPRARLAMARSRGVAAARPSPSRRRARACARSAGACR